MIKATSRFLASLHRSLQVIACLAIVGISLFSELTSFSQPRLPKGEGMMWEEAIAASARSGKPTIVFNLDLADSATIRFYDAVFSDARVLKYLERTFEIGLNDFSVDPPATVGFDSLRALGLRLSGFERKYRLQARPAALIIGRDSMEVERVLGLDKFTPESFIARLDEILAGRNTLRSYVEEFWRDTTSIPMRQQLIEQLEIRSKYDSVLYHLGSLAFAQNIPTISREAAMRYAFMRLQVEGFVRPMKDLLDSFDRHGEDSLLYLSGIRELIDFYQTRKVWDSVAQYYENYMSFTQYRDPDVLNEFAWEMANFTNRHALAMELIDEALRSDPNNPNYLDTKATVHLHKGEMTEAVLLGERALKLAPEEDLQYFTERLKYYNTVRTSEEERLRQEAEEDAAEKKAADKKAAESKSSKRSTKKTTKPAR